MEDQNQGLGLTTELSKKALTLESTEQVIVICPRCGKQSPFVYMFEIEQMNHCPGCAWSGSWVILHPEKEC